MFRHNIMEIRGLARHRHAVPHKGKVFAVDRSRSIYYAWDVLRAGACFNEAESELTEHVAQHHGNYRTGARHRRPRRAAQGLVFAVDRSGRIYASGMYTYVPEPERRQPS
jgi:hypothetical protein